MKFTRLELVKTLEAARIGVRNSLTIPIITGRVINQGFDEKTLKGLDSLYQLAELKFMEKDKSYQEKIIARKEFRGLFKKAYKYYMKYIKLLRKALWEDEIAMESLGIFGERERTKTGWMVQAKEFYNNAINNPAIMEKISRFAITKEKLELGLKLITDVEASDDFQTFKNGEAEVATFYRNKVFTQLYRRMLEFKQACINEFEDDPQLLEMIGIPALTEGYKRKTTDTTTEKAKKTHSPEGTM